ncbi:DUF3987 domain-containing protein, partial [uncultured Agitococcus sp.]|uniref:DUF3987 domain-containing protein n=1 Tax=uncultured Agitococcus sp. TaxID=1506599 RepID=UPI00260AFEBF
HAYWLVNNCELEQFKQLQQALAAKFDGDKAVNDLPRVMRLAGFSHNKAESFITRIRTMQDNLYPYSVNKLIVGLGLELEKNKNTKPQAAIVAISAIDKDDFTIGLPPTDETIADIKSALDYLSCEEYHDWIRQAMHLKTLGNAGLELWLTWSSTSAKYNRAEAIDKWHSLQADRTGYKAIFNEAKANGWINPLSNQWQEPDPIIEPQEATDYPIDELPEPLRLLVLEIVDYLQCPIALAANSVLAALSLSTQGLVNVSRDNSLIGAVSLFLMVIAESGERKSACDNLVLKAIKKLNDEHFCHDKEQNNDYLTELNIWNSQNNGLHASLTQASKSGEPTDDLKEKIKTHAMTKPMQPKGTTFLYEDATIEALTKGLYFNSPSGGIFSSEAGVVFGSHGMSKDNSTRTMGNINKLWDGDSIIVGRSDVSNNMLLTGRRLTLCLATQESTVRAFFDGTNGSARGIGFGARFLIAWPKSTQGTRLYKAPPSHWPHLTRFSSHVLSLLNTDLTIDENTGALQPITLHLSQQALEAWIEFYNDTEQELCTGGELTDIKDVTSKAADNVARIAALFHVYEHGITGNISEDHLRSAGRIMFWHLMESKRFFNELSLSKELRHATMLDNWLLNYCKEHQTTEISTRTLKQLCPNSLRNKSSFDDAISHLIDLNRVKIVNQGKKKLIHLNPKLFEV